MLRITPFDILSFSRLLIKLSNTFIHFKQTIFPLDRFFLLWVKFWDYLLVGNGLMSEVGTLKYYVSMLMNWFWLFLDIIPLQSLNRISTLNNTLIEIFSVYFFLISSLSHSTNSRSWMLKFNYGILSCIRLISKRWLFTAWIYFKIKSYWSTNR